VRFDAMNRGDCVVRRNIGLDLVRAIAIAMVVLFHAPVRLPGKGIFEMVSVDLFFSLSGLLIAQMVFERFNLISSPRDFALFMVNRWVRTFPLYYLFILVNIGLVAIGPFIRSHYPGQVAGIGAVPNLLPFLVFLQNATEGGNRNGNWFSVSWSLCIEEWFYLLLALALLLLPLRSKMSNRVWFCGGLALLVAMLLARIMVYLTWDYGSLTFDNGYRGVLMLRIDAFVYGGAAYLWQRELRGTPAARIARLMVPAAMAGMLVIAASWILRRNAPDDFWTKLLIPSTVPFGAALLLPYFAGLPLSASGVAGRAASFLSARTYSIYLAHIPLQYLFFSFIAISYATYAAFLAFMLTAAHLIYVYIERPIMALRPLSAAARRNIAAAPAPPLGCDEVHNRPFQTHV
jgi:peptidoglycan/LPS O-acetylase OafA/YrhL